MSTYCAFCDSKLGLFTKKSAKILPKSLYDQLRGLKYLHGHYKVSLTDPRNIVACCSCCMNSYSKDMLVPDCCCSRY